MSVCADVSVCASVWEPAHVLPGALAEGQQQLLLPLMFDFIQSKLTDDAKSFHSIKF